MPMQPSDLELCTTRELVEELMRRKTFLGIVVHSEQELKSESWDGERVFKVHYNANLDAAQACRLLNAICEYMDRNAC
jgi:hypothetical protein